MGHLRGGTRAEPGYSPALACKQIRSHTLTVRVIVGPKVAIAALVAYGDN